jgi:hypothetical protein
MRWKLLRRRLSVSAPRMIVRSRLPWPFRWAVAAVAFGFSAAIAVWAFEFGKEIAGLDRDAKQELAQLRVEVERLRAENERASSVANTAESLLRAERAAQDKLAQTVRQMEAETQSLKADLGFFERLLPASGDGLLIRGLKAEPAATPGQMRFQLLVMQNGKDVAEFSGRYEVTLAGTLAGRNWTSPPENTQRGPLKVRQYARVDGVIDHPADLAVKAMQVRLLDAGGAVRATQTLRL